MEAAGDDVDGDDDVASLTYVITSTLPRGAGAVTDNGDGTFSYDPGGDFQELAEGETIEVAFAYKAIDRHGATSDFALGTITVTGVNDAPTATDLAFATSEDGPILTQTLSGDDIDSDDDAASLTYVIGSLPGKGTLTDNGDGTFSFDPGSDFDALGAGQSEDVTFTYQSKAATACSRRRRPSPSRSPGSTTHRWRATLLLLPLKTAVRSSEAMR